MLQISLVQVFEYVKSQSLVSKDQRNAPRYTRGFQDACRLKGPDLHREWVLIMLVPST